MVGDHNRFIQVTFVVLVVLQSIVQFKCVTFKCIIHCSCISNSRFRTGPGVVPEQAPQETENLLLILNGRETEKVTFAKSWLDSLKRFPRLQNVALLLLGDEQCNNSWLQPYMDYNGGRVKLVFLVYDSPEIDEVHFFQWPLGVAT